MVGPSPVDSKGSIGPQKGADPAAVKYAKTFFDNLRDSYVVKAFGGKQQMVDFMADIQIQTGQAGATLRLTFTDKGDAVLNVVDQDGNLVKDLGAELNEKLAQANANLKAAKGLKEFLIEADYKKLEKVGVKAEKSPDSAVKALGLQGNQYNKPYRLK